MNNKQIQEKKLQPLLEFTTLPLINIMVIAKFLIVLLIVGLLALRIGNTIWLIICIIFSLIAFLYSFIFPIRYVFTEEGIEIYDILNNKHDFEWDYFKFYYANNDGINLSPVILNVNAVQYEKPKGMITIPWDDEHKLEMLDLIKHYVYSGAPIPREFLRKQY